MSNFDPNAILRGAQLTLVGAHRALQNPELFTTTHYRQAAIAVCAGLAIRIILNIPIYAVKFMLLVTSLFVNLDHETWDDKLVNGLDFISKSVLQVPFFLMMVMSSITPTLDNLFMDSLAWVDKTYLQKHKSDDPSTLRGLYHPTLKVYSTHGARERKERRSPLDGLISVGMKYGRRAAISLAIYTLTFAPIVGPLVLPAASFYTFNKAVGPVPAGIVFGLGFVLPKRYMVSFLQTYFSSRSLMSRLLEPYFSRIRFTKQQKKVWFMDRSGVLFGFSAAFAVMVKVPLLGVLIYGIAEASTAYLITKITEPPPPPGSETQVFIENEVRWKNKHLLLNLPLDKLDEFNARLTGAENVTQQPSVPDTPRRRFA
ncbi:hypothetical protein A1O3_05570 [Capronia epimyces CBS 606.96]|uniref:Transmembrane protein UsgS n=1 Tax=Capronia epimyces CBS 606.96 TaxID=1182542 RepID=W9Y5K6_9EURO|nr:uncharacterized protein A1O3_05570 [Capronia epimyces CBS 606.96]EXJ84895.1 hypothetical protein A1O3_05570 [Capronia epimyces CBS 606.96]